MNRALWFGLIIGLMLVVGWLGQELDITTTILSGSTPSLDAPTDGGFLNQILLPFKWAFNAVASFIQIMFFSADIPTLANAIIFTPLAFVTGVLVFMLIRGN